MGLEELRSLYEVSESDFLEIQQLIIDIFTSGVKKSKSPLAIILGGQPGSGKSELITAAQQLIRNLNETLVICNADDYRDFHPRSEEIKRDHEEYYPELTVKYAQAWNNGLRAFCEDNRFNYVMETTFSSGELMNETLTTIKKKNYQVAIMLLAVNRKWSYLGTYIRYEDMKAASGSGRMVPKKIHDEKYHQVLSTLDCVAEKHLYDHIYIFGRSDPEDHSRKHGVTMLQYNPKDIITCYLDERDKSWSRELENYFLDCCTQIERKMKKRGASNAAIKKFYQDIQ